MAVSFTWGELVWAALSVGKAEAIHLVRFGIYSGFELLYRAAMIYANLRVGTGDTLQATKAFDSLDPSEKGAMSYFFGLATAKLLAEKRLGISWLMHLDVYRSQLNPLILRRGKAKPDLLGADSSGNWVVIEAKGRSGVMPAKVMARAKSQTANLLSVSGKAVSLGIAHGSYFSRRRLAVRWIDPRPRRRGARLELDRVTFDAAYYAPIRRLLDEDRPSHIVSVQGRLCRLVTAPELDLRLGLTVSQEPHAPIGEQNSVTSPSGPEISSEYVGGDGIAIQLGPSWLPERMQLEPSDRPVVPLSVRLSQRAATES